MSTQGLHLLEVKGEDSHDGRESTRLVTNFVAGDVGPTTPTTPGTGNGDELQAEIDRLEDLS